MKTPPSSPGSEEPGPPTLPHPMDLDIPTPNFCDDIQKFIDSLSLPEHNEWKKFVEAGATDIEVSKVGMEVRKRELDDVMHANKAIKEEEDAIANRPLLQDAIEAAKMQRRRAAQNAIEKGEGKEAGVKVFPKPKPHPTAMPVVKKDSDQLEKEVLARESERPRPSVAPALTLLRHEKK